MDKRQRVILKEYKTQLLNLNKIINDWDLIPGCPSDEFEHLSNLLLSQLWKGADQLKLRRIIRDEIIGTYGLYCDDKSAASFAQEIVEWWFNEN